MHTLYSAEISTLKRYS